MTDRPVLLMEPGPWRDRRLLDDLAIALSDDRPDNRRWAEALGHELVKSERFRSAIQPALNPDRIWPATSAKIPSAQARDLRRTALASGLAIGLALLSLALALGALLLR